MLPPFVLRTAKHPQTERTVPRASGRYLVEADSIGPSPCQQACVTVCGEVSTTYRVEGAQSEWVGLRAPDASEFLDRRLLGWRDFLGVTLQSFTKCEL